MKRMGWNMPPCRLPLRGERIGIPREGASGNAASPRAARCSQFVVQLCGRLLAGRNFGLLLGLEKVLRQPAEKELQFLLRHRGRKGVAQVVLV